MHLETKKNKIIVVKFGGSSLSNTRRIKACCKIVSNIKEKVVVIVSAMANMTNQLESRFDSIKNNPETDVVLSAGEQISAGLFSNYLARKSQSLMAWQIPIKTNSNFGDADILKINPKPILYMLEKGITPVIPGYQGITSSSKITTLGKGGSDLTATAIAHYVGADECRLYKDVEGVYSADPKKTSSAFKINQITFDEIEELSLCGAQIFQSKAASFAKKNKVKIRILSTFIDDSGTEVVNQITPRLASIIENKDYFSFIGQNIKNSEHIKIIQKLGQTINLENNKIDVISNFNISQMHSKIFSTRKRCA